MTAAARDAAGPPPLAGDLVEVPDRSDATDGARPAGTARRRWPWPLAIPLLCNAWTLRQLLLIVSWPNDVPFHVAMVDWAHGRLQHGTVPLDGWFPRLSGGLPQFHAYQSLPHLLTGALGLGLGVDRAFALVTFLLLVCWPVAVYTCARAFGLSRRAGLLAATVAPLVRSPTGYGFESFSYLWTGNGLWSQLWGMWGLPLGLAWSARAVRTGRGFGRAVAANAFTVACHLPTAWFGLLSLGLWPLARPGEWRRRVPRTVVVGGLSLLASAWLLVPFLTDQWATNDSSFNGEAFFSDSFGWRKVGGWLLAGDIVDSHRLPLLSLVALLGLVTCVASWRRADRTWARELVLLLVAATVLFVGRDPFGPLIDLLPGAKLVFLHRYHAVIQLVLVLLAGVGADAAWRWARPRLPASWPELARVALGLAVLAAVLVPGARQTVAFTSEDRSWVELQRRADETTGVQFAQLVAIAHDRGDGRIYAGRINNWGRSFRIGAVPAPMLLAQYPVQSMGFNLRVSSLSADLETYLSDADGADLAAMGIRYVILPRGQAVPSGAFFLTNRGDLQLWELPTGGLLQVIDLVAPVVRTDRSHLAERLLPPMRTSERNPTVVQAVDFAGRTPPGALARAADPAEPPGRVVAQRQDLDAGAVDATVAMRRAGTLMLRVNWHPRWVVTVDGRPVRTEMAAPTWLAVPVPAGRHQVAFRYHDHPASWPLALAGLLAVALGWWLSRHVQPWDRWEGPGRGIGRPRRRAVGRHARPSDVGPGPAGPLPEDHHAAARTSWGRRILGPVLAAALLGACGSPHRLAPVPTVPGGDHGRLSAAVRSVVLRSPTRAVVLGDALAPDRPTVLVLVPPGCEGCAAALPSIRAAAFGTKPFSVLVIGLPLPAPAAAAASTTQGLDLYGLDGPDLAVLQRSLRVGARGAVLVVTPVGGVMGRFGAVGDPAAIISEATSP